MGIFQHTSRVEEIKPIDIVKYAEKQRKLKGKLVNTFA
jgi:hypothetical protein